MSLHVMVYAVWSRHSSCPLPRYSLWRHVIVWIRSVCDIVYIDIYEYVYIYIYIYKSIYKWIDVCVHVSTLMHMYTHVSACACLYIVRCMHVMCMCESVNVCMYTCLQVCSSESGFEVFTILWKCFFFTFAHLEHIWRAAASQVTRHKRRRRLGQASCRIGRKAPLPHHQAAAWRRESCKG